MKSNHLSIAGRSALFLVAISTTSSEAWARTVPPGTSMVVKGSGSAPESWNVGNGAALQLMDGAKSKNISLWSAFLLAENATVTTNDAVGIYASNATEISLYRSKVTSSNGAAVVLTSTSDLPGGIPSNRATAIDSIIEGRQYGAIISAGSQLNLTRSAIAATAEDGVGVEINGGAVTAVDGSTIRGKAVGIVLNNAWSGINRLEIAGSSIIAGDGPAIKVDGLGKSDGASHLVIRDGAFLQSGNDNVVEVSGGARLSAGIEASDIAGNVVVDPGSFASITLARGGSLRGAVSGPADLAIGEDSSWTMSTTSEIQHLSLDGGNVHLEGGDAAQTLRVRGDLAGRGGNLTLGITSDGMHMSGNRVVIDGDVNTSGPVLVEVGVSGQPFSTDANGNGTAERDEGVSLIQVAGQARADAFQLKGGYVAAGPFQYVLHAFGPSENAESEGDSLGAASGWDYRFASRTVCDESCDGEGSTSPGESEGTPSRPHRLALTPQVPSYLSVSAALMGYERTLAAGLSERLGDIRMGEPSDPVGGEMFARYVGGQVRYSSNLSFQRYGYAFDQRIDALQLGGGLVALDGDNGSLRAGWAWDKGSTTVSPRAVDGDSMTRYRAYGVSGWVAWAHGNGPWVDAWVGSRRYRGSIDTASRGRNVATIRSTARTISLEGGWPLAAGGAWSVEPRVQVARTWLASRTGVDRDGLTGSFAPLAQTELTMGTRITHDARGVLRPFLGLELTGVHGGGARVGVGVPATPVMFDGARLRNAYRVVSGVTGQLSDNLHVYGQADYRHGLGGYGSRMWSWQAGIRFNF